MLRTTLATIPETRLRDRSTYEEWGPPLTEVQFFDRETRLRAHPWALANMQTWLLKSVDGQVAASCETFRMESRSKSFRGSTHAVASVFTNPSLRGQGLAAQLLTEVTHLLRAQDQQMQALILFSDVGEKIYGRLGYRPLPAFDWVWPAEAGEPRGLSRAEIQSSALRPAALSAFQIEPSLLQLDWHFERTEIYAQHLQRPQQLTFGLAVKGQLLAAWAAQWKENTLYVLFNRAETAEEMRFIQRATQAEAHRLGLPTVTQWENAANTTKLPMPSGTQRQVRDGAIPMIFPVHSTLTDLPPAAGIFSTADRTLTSQIWPECPRALWV